MVIDRIIQLTVPCSDDGKKFVQTDRIDLIQQALIRSKYGCMADLPLAKIYRHRDFKAAQPSILLSCHIDSLYTKYYAAIHDKELHGTFDNSACNAIAVDAMINGLFPSQTLISFTGNEEKHYQGADQTVESLKAEGIFDNLELVIVLDIAEEDRQSYRYTNHFVKKVKGHSLLEFGGKNEFKAFLENMLAEKEEDESEWYDIYNLNIFSFYLPCRLLSFDMHGNEGVAIEIEAIKGYRYALGRLTQEIDKELADRRW